MNANRKPMSFVPLLLAALLAAVLVSSADACPMCKAALDNPDEPGGDLVSGFFYSILFMLSMPFAILGVFSGMMYREVKRAKAAHASTATASEPPSGNTR